MEELIRCNDLVLLSAAEALLEGAGIDCLVVGAHMAVLEGSQAGVQAMRAHGRPGHIINTSTLGAIQLTRSGGDGIFGNGNDVAVSAAAGVT